MATLSQKERRDLYSSTMERLTEVIGASGKAEELVKLTTQIVQAAKKLVEGTPDAMKNKSRVTLAEFVIAAKKIAQDTRAVDSVSLQKLSSTRKAIELLLKDLDAWHTTHSAKEEISLDDILSQTASQKTRTDHRNSLIFTGGREPVLIAGAEAAKNGKGSPIEPLATEQEKKLVMELKKQQDGLLRRAEPQTNPNLHGNPEEILKVAVAGLSRSASQLMDQAGERAPSKETLVEPTITLAKMVSILMDIVDTLFVSKFPMRSQVHSFCCMLVENVLAYGDQSRTEDTASVRLISTQVPAMMSALEVMVEQCFKRSRNIQESQQMSLQRKADLHDLDVFGPGQSPRNSPATKRRKEPPTPPGKKSPLMSTPQVQEFEICVMICTSVGVDGKTNILLNKGAEIMLKATSNTTVRDVRAVLKERTSLPLENIQLRFRGDDVLTEDTRVTPDNPVPYFMFNLHEPGDEELVEFRRDQRKKHRVRIDTKDWSKVPSSVAVAVYDYEALAEPGEEDNLEFAEGDLIEIVEQSADGWWTGKVDGSVGVFPASFVEMIQIPKNKEERKRLLKRYHQGRLGEQNQSDPNPVDDLQTKEPPVRPPDPKILPAQKTQIFEPSSTKPPKQGLNRVFSRSSTSSDTSDSTRSPSPTKAPSSSFSNPLDRRTSDPLLSPGEMKEKDGKPKKRLSLFKKKPPSSGYVAITDDFQRSPILSHKNNSKPMIPELEEEMKVVNPVVFPAATKPLFRPKSSPRLALGKTGVQPPPPPPPTMSQPAQPATSNPRLPPPAEEGGDAEKNKLKRRPPPPPPPYAKTYGPRGVHKVIKRLESGDREEELRSQTLPFPGDHPPPIGADNDVDAPSIAMTVTPASPVTLSRREQEESKMDGDTTSSVSSGQNNEMEDLLKNLEEFNEFSSTQSLPNGFKKAARDYATIPRDELPVRMDDEDDDDEEEEEEEEENMFLSRPSSVPAPIATPTVVEDRPCLTPNPTISTNTMNPSLPFLPPPPTPSSAPPSSASLPDSSSAPPPPDLSSASSPPVKPPRSRSKRMRLRKELEIENSQQQLDKSDPPPSNPPPPLPKSVAPAEVSSPPQPSPPRSHPSPSPKQYRPVFHTPKPPSSQPPPLPPPVENGLNNRGETQSSPASIEAKPKPAKPKPQGPKPQIPVVPPRNKRSLKRPGKTPPEDGKKPLVSVKPRPPQMARTQLEVMERPQCSSAPGSRTSSPDDSSHSSRLREGVASSSSTSNLCTKGRESNRLKENEDGSSSPLVNRAVAGGKSTTLLYKTAMKCISYLTSGHLVREEKLMASDGNPLLINKLLTAIDNSEEVDLNSLQEAPSVLGLLVALFGKPHLGHLISHELAKEMSSAVQSADPISVLGNKLEKLTPNYRELLKSLLRLFGKILKHSHKNLTGVEDIDEKFGPVVFENISSAQSEPLLAYLISTCEFLIAD